MRLPLVVICLLSTAPALAQPTPEPTPAPPPTEPTPPPEPQPVDQIKPSEPPPVVAPEPDKPPEAEPPKKLHVGTNGLFQPGILFQGWFTTEIADGDAQLSTFRVRRAELSAKGEILPKRVAYGLMFDVARVREFADVTITTPSGETVVVKQPITPVSPLQDLMITFLTEYADVSLGQFKIPVSWEGVNSSAKVLFPERAPVSVLFGDKRDLGLKVYKTFPKWSYYAGIFNGLGSNNLDNNNQKDLALRLEAYPIKGLTLGGVAYDSVGYRKRKGTKDRWELDVRYEVGPLLVQGEFIEARDVKADGADATPERGFYLGFGYTIENPELHGSLQPIIRVGFLDPDADKNLDPVADKDDELLHYDAGVNYYLEGHEMKLQASYQRQQFDQRIANNQIIVAAQVWY